ncbi:NDMA-dependent alcohol dehydrogenase [Pseudonocardia spirodelae]|uniref:NDMA-dependent alcohol dehydrogenase n=1 Tax=Pseudonocardia spirodelae TaxID=3133431 RepID=A0ABU8T694_9PSEU
MDAAVLWEPGTDWSVEEVELDGPKHGEVLVRWEASGLCHSDHHPRAGDIPASLPAVGGHEGAGVVLEVGDGVSGFKEGDHVVGSFLPACGKCRWCSTGQQNLCDFGALIMAGHNLDGTFRRRARGRDVGSMSMLGTFAPYGTVPEQSLVAIDEDIPLDKACLVGCGVTTGWGSAVNTAGVRQGDTVVVVGIGGIGAGAVQGARLGGAEQIVAIDPVASKKEHAEGFGATHFAPSMADAVELVRDLTRGVMADSVILTPGLVEGSMIAEALELTRKGGATVVTGLASVTDTAAQMSLVMFTLFQKRLLGSLFGEANPRADIPKLLRLYRAGKLKLDETVTQEYKLTDINGAYDDMLAGRNIRGVVRHQH